MSKAGKVLGRRRATLDLRACALAIAAASSLFGCEEPAIQEGTEIPAVSRFARLTHTQWRNTVADLLRSTDLPDLAQNFRPDPRQQGFLFGNDADALAVDEALWSGYQQSAAEVAALVVSDPARLAKIAPDEGSSEARGRAFIEAFGKRAHRRPLSEAQVESYLSLYSQGREVFPELGAVEAGIRLLIQAFLQSPHLLYRIESSADARSGTIPLDGYEVASRLSYALWDTMPDDDLLEAAEAGELDTADEVEEHARRMLDSERAKPALVRFHSRLFETERYAAILRFPIEELPHFAEEEHRRFVQHVVFEEDGRLADLLTSTQTFANAELAELYGLSGDFDEEFKLVELDPDQRSGFLTQIGFLAANANSGVPDPIHRGVFVARRMACLDIPMPPPGIPPLPAAGGRTNRETVAAHTEGEGTVCASCHSKLINPFGFPFEYYDGLGRYRTEDNGQAVDGTTTPELEPPAPVDNAIELADALAKSEQVHACYAKHLLEFTFGRLSVEQDEPLIRQITTASAGKEQASVKELLVQLVSSRSFLNRRAEESP